MLEPRELNVSFQYDGIDYNIKLVKDGEADHSVKINGVAYAVFGDKEKLDSSSKDFIPINSKNR